MRTTGQRRASLHFARLVSIPADVPLPITDTASWKSSRSAGQIRTYDAPSRCAWTIDTTAEATVWMPG